MNENIKQRIESIVNNIEQLPSMPAIATKVINMVNNPDVSFKQVAQEISQNQAMTTNVLKLCNSAYFNKGKEISSIDRAIVTLGLKEVKNIVLVVAAKPLLEKPVIGYDLAQGDLWKQGLIVATIANRIALAKKRKDIADTVFTGGIIHNIGKIVIALYVQQAFNEIMETVQANETTFQQAEKEVMGYSHQEVSEKVLEKWNFPDVLKSIVRYYQEPEKAPDEHKLEVSIIHVSNSISILAGVGIGSDGLYHQINDQAVKTAGLSQAELEALYTKIPETIKKISTI